MKIALFGTAEIEEKHIPYMSFLLDNLRRSGAELAFYEPYYPYIKKVAKDNYVRLPEGQFFTKFENLPEGIDIFLCLGGDGTFLQSLSIVRERNITVLGLNFGRLGFLTAAKVYQWDSEIIDSIIEGNYSIVERSTIHVDGVAFPDDFYPYALNEVSIQRRSPYMLGIDLKIDGIKLPTYWADGLIIATPTGSTAYSLSVGGPIMTPNAKGLIISPIAPHNLNMRPIIVPDSAELELSLSMASEDVMLTVDNKELIIPSNSVVKLKKGEFTMKTASFGREGFFYALREKLLWGADRRNEEII